MARRVIHGDMLQELPRLAADGERFHSVVTDPPYHLTQAGKSTMHDKTWQEPNALQFKRLTTGFMGKEWDGGDVAFRPETWRAVFDVMLPGAYLVAFGGTRTWHRMAVAIEDAGFEIRDTLCWLYGSGFPKSLDVSKAIDKAVGATREVVGGRVKLQSYGANNVYGDGPDKGGVQLLTAPATPEAAAWAGWGTALKPAFEPIILARRPLQGTVAANVLRHGTGAINIDKCRVAGAKDVPASPSRTDSKIYGKGSSLTTGQTAGFNPNAGRYPANLLHDGSDEVEAAFAAFGNSESSSHTRHNQVSLGSSSGGIYGAASGFNGNGIADTGSASRFFYCAKADRGDRADSRHPTIKPIALLRWLVKLVCPPGGTVLDPFAGSGTTGEAAMLEGFDAVLIERDAQHAADIRHRIKRWSGLDAPLFAEVAD